LLAGLVRRLSAAALLLTAAVLTATLLPAALLPAALARLLLLLARSRVVLLVGVLILVRHGSLTPC
jgi:hypothetical protein